MSDDAGVGQELRGVIETLRRRDQQYRLLAEQAADGVLLVGADGRIGDASPGASVLLARPRAQLVKLPLAELVEADKAVDNVNALLGRCASGSGSRAPTACAARRARRSTWRSAPGAWPTAACSWRCATSPRGGAPPTRCARARTATSGSRPPPRTRS